MDRARHTEVPPGAEPGIGHFSYVVVTTWPGWDRHAVSGKFEGVGERPKLKIERRYRNAIIDINCHDRPQYSTILYDISMIFQRCSNDVSRRYSTIFDSIPTIFPNIPIIFHYIPNDAVSSTILQRCSAIFQWYSTTFHDIPTILTIFHDIPTLFNDIPRYSTIFHDTPRCYSDIPWYYTIFQDIHDITMMFNDTLRYSTILNDIHNIPLWDSHTSPPSRIGPTIVNTALSHK